MNLNKVFLIGRLTADPELKTTPSGQSVATVRMATNSVFTDKAGKKQETTEFHTVVVWARQAEIVHQYLKKGSEAYVEGRLQTRSWDDKQSGQKRYATEVVAERVQFGSRPTGQTSAAGFGGGAASHAGGVAQGQWSSHSAVAPARPATGTPSGSAEASQEPVEEIPIIDVDADGDIKPEDLPF